jgi:diguanylate cyclase (GGDEF)-like protein/PAS domain S-box-containing protein
VAVKSLACPSATPAGELDRLFSQVLDQIAAATVITDHNQRILAVNRAFTEITGYTEAEALGQTPRLLSSGHHDPAFYQAMWAEIRATGRWSGEIHDRRKCGEVYRKHLTIQEIPGKDGAPGHYLGVFTDLHAHEAAPDLAYFDPLTNLPNRRLLVDRLQRTVATAARHDEIGALLFIDLDRFKALNDTHGHEIGDDYLVEVAARLRDCVRGVDLVARLGGDEFVVLMEGLDLDPSQAAAHAGAMGERCLAALSAPYPISGEAYHGSASIGILLIHTGGSCAREALRHADTAMYEAKRIGRNTLCFFDPEMQRAMEESACLDRELHLALKNQEFVLHYQLQVDEQGAPIGVEALLRWQHPEQGEVLPERFLARAEGSGLIVQIGHWCLDTVCAQIKAWEDHPVARRLPVSINISARQIRQADFAERIRAAVARHGIPPHRLRIEITEATLLQDMVGTIAKLDSLHALGVQFSLDDFGTGYSSLAQLKRLPIRQLKIDGSLVGKALHDTTDAEIMAAILAMGRSLQLDIIAEGVETAEQRAFLVAHGCRAFQGRAFAPPLPAALLEQRFAS